MKSRFRYDDLAYGVLLAALISFAFATVLDDARSNEFSQQVVSATVMAAQTAAAVASSTAAAVSPR